MNLTAALRYLDQHTNLEATAGRAEGLSLERMASLVSVLGDPQGAMKPVAVCRRPKAFASGCTNSAMPVSSARA